MGMGYYPSNPLIAQSDKTVLLAVNNPLYEEARDALARFAELEKSPEHIHTYRITPLSLWNAAAAGLDAASIVGGLERFGKYASQGFGRLRWAVVANFTRLAIAVGGGWVALRITGDLTSVFIAVGLGLAAFGLTNATALASRAVVPRVDRSKA